MKEDDPGVIFPHCRAKDHPRIVSHGHQPVGQGQGVVFTVAAGVVESLPRTLPDVLPPRVLLVVALILELVGDRVEGYPELFSPERFKSVEIGIDKMVPPINTNLPKWSPANPALNPTATCRHDDDRHCLASRTRKTVRSGCRRQI